MTNIKMISWNVNGLRAVEQKGFWDFFKKEKPDILCLQEIKADRTQLSERLQNFANDEEFVGYDVLYASAEKKGYSGVAVFYKKALAQKVQVGLGEQKFDGEGRTIVFESEKFILVNSYYPNGQDDLKRVPYKLQYSELVLAETLKWAKRKKKGIILTGDFNTAHQEIDLANPKQNVGNTGFLPIERAFLDKLIAAGFVDAFREEHPEQKAQYTWWSYRGGCRARNVGWRLDYFFVSKDFYAKLQKKKMRHLTDVMGSDHCPVSLELSL